ncbi:MAG TPA: hypothetical protein VF933_33665 [Streptosporangiaceae bacterium]
MLERIQPQADGEHELVMLGWPGASWHLELVADPEGQTPPAPTVEDLQVLYRGQPADRGLTSAWWARAGGSSPPANPYWERWGITIADPDGYRLVLSHRSWP